MNEDKKGFEGRSTTGGLGSNRDRDDVSLTRSQTGHDTDGRSPDYDDRSDMTREESRHRSAGGGGASQSASQSASTAGATTADSLGDNVDGMGRDRTDAVTADETGKLISADKVIGTPVYNANGDRLGTIDGIMLHKISGRVAFAVLSAGGFLGIGERYHPLPWDVLTYDEEKGGYNVDLKDDQLRAAPHYSRQEIDTYGYGTDSGRIHDYYGVSSDAYALGRAAGGSAAWGTSTQGTTHTEPRY